MKFTKSMEGKKAIIVAENGRKYEGKILDYIYPEDNEPEGIAGICIRTLDGELVGFDEPEVEQIKIIES